MSEHRHNLYPQTNEQMTMQRQPPYQFPPISYFTPMVAQPFMDYTTSIYNIPMTANAAQQDQMVSVNPFYPQHNQLSPYRAQMPPQQQQPQQQVEMKPHPQQQSLVPISQPQPQQQQPPTQPQPIRARAKQRLFDFQGDKNAEVAPVPVEVKPDSKPNSVTVPVEHHHPSASGSGKSNFLFEVPKEELVQPAVTAPAKVESPEPVGVTVENESKDPYNDWLSGALITYAAPYKSKDTCTRIRYTYEEMIQILNNPFGRYKVDQRPFQEMRKIVHKNSHTRMKLPGFTFDIQTSNIEKVEGAYVPSHLKDKQESVDPAKQLLKDLNAVLNRLMEGNLSVSLEEIKQLNVSTPQNLPILARAVFDMAIKQTKFAKAFSKLTKHYWDSVEFKKEMIEIMQSRIEKPIEKHVEEASLGVDAELAKVTDETRRKILEERRETVMLKAEEAYFGTMTFMSELYTAGLFSVQQLINIVKRFVANLTENSAKSLTIILGIAGKSLDAHEKAKMDDLYKQFETQMTQANLPSFTIYHIDILLKKRAQGWHETEFKPVHSYVSSNHKHDSDSKKSQLPLNSLSSINPTNLSLTTQGGNLKPRTKWDTGCNSAAQSKSGGGRKTQPASMAPAAPLYSEARHQEELKQLQKHGDPVSLFASKDTSYQESFARSYKPAFVHHVVDQMMNKKKEDRFNAGDMFSALMTFTPPLTGEDMVEGFKQFSKLIDDYLEDCPLLYDYFAELFHRLILSPSTLDCTFLVHMFREMNANAADKKGVTVLLQTIKMAHQNVPQGTASPDTFILNRFNRHIRSMIIQQLSVPEQELAKLCVDHQCVFLGSSVEQPPPAQQLSRHSMPPGVHQNGSARSSALPVNSSWAQHATGMQIAQRPPQQPSTTPVPILVKSQTATAPQAASQQQQLDEGWVTNKKKGKSRGQDRNRASVPPSPDVITLLETAKSLPTAAVIREKVEQYQGDPVSILPQFSQKLLLRICGLRKEELRQYVELLALFRISKVEHQMTLLGVLDNNTIKLEQRRSLLDAVVDQKLVSMEAIKRWLSDQGENKASSQLAGLLKAKFDL